MGKYKITPIKSSQLTKFENTQQTHCETCGAVKKIMVRFQDDTCCSLKCINAARQGFADYLEAEDLAGEQ